MGKAAAFVYNDQLSRHVLRDDHPMRPERLRHTYEILEAFNAFDSVDSTLVLPRPATEEEVLSFHTSDYLLAVRSLSESIVLWDPRAYGFGRGGDNPFYKGMYDAALLSTGASMVATELVLANKVQVAFNPSGGLHHAMPDRASGFCVFNDPVIAIKAMVAKGLRVAYVDIDAHHGDGVQDAFYDTDAVLTISIHESGNYLFPGSGVVEEIGQGKGKGYSVNVPIGPYTGDELYMWAFREVVPPILEAFKPDALVTQLGIDSYFRDPLTHLALTTHGFVEAVRSLAEAAHSTPWIALGGGGYDLSAVVRCWALAYGVMTSQDWPDAVPDILQQRLGTATLRDGESPEFPTEMQDLARRFAEASVQEVRERIFSYHGL